MATKKPPKVVHVVIEQQRVQPYYRAWVDSPGGAGKKRAQEDASGGVGTVHKYVLPDAELSPRILDAVKKMVAAKLSLFDLSGLGSAKTVTRRSKAARALCQAVEDFDEAIRVLDVRNRLDAPRKKKSAQ